MLEPELTRHRVLVRLRHEVRVIHPQAWDEPQPERFRGFSRGPHRIRTLRKAHAGVLHALFHQRTRRFVRRLSPADATGDLGVVVHQVAAHPHTVDQGLHRRVGERGDVRAQQGFRFHPVGHDEREVRIVVEDETECRERSRCLGAGDGRRTESQPQQQGQAKPRSADFFLGATRRHPRSMYERSAHGFARDVRSVRRTLP